MPRAARTVALVLTVPILAVLAIAATSVLSDDSSAGDGRDDLVIAGFAFHPETLRLDADEAVRVTNDDTVTHTVTAEDGSFDTGNIEGGGQARIDIDGAGEFAYFCRIHDSMRGTIEIVG